MYKDPLYPSLSFIRILAPCSFGRYKTMLMTNELRALAPGGKFLFKEETPQI